MSTGHSQSPKPIGITVSSTLASLCLTQVRKDIGHLDTAAGAAAALVPGAGGRAPTPTGAARGGGALKGGDSEIKAPAEGYCYLRTYPLSAALGDPKQAGPFLAG